MDDGEDEWISSDPEKKRTNLQDLDDSDFELYDIDFSTIAEDDIMDKSKGDTIAKLLVVVQTSWFAIQCAARVSPSQGLPVTALQLTTLGHTAFVVIIYFMQGEASQGVDESDRNGMELHTLPLLKTSTVNLNGPHNPGPYQLSWRIRFGIYLPGGKFESMESSVKEWVLFISLLIISSIFGTMHCLGWNSYFSCRANILACCCSNYHSRTSHSHWTDAFQCS
jgi:hypothetical protein